MCKINHVIWLKVASYISVLLVLIAGLGIGCSRDTFLKQGNISPLPSPYLSASPTNGLVQTSSGGGVDIRVEWRGFKDGSVVFGVAMDTHSGSIDQYDLKDLAVLRDSNGKEYFPGNTAIPLGGHHRTGLLTFPVPAVSNPSKAKYVDLILRDIAGVAERDLRWELN